ncbi:MAG TPA: helix-turn-helix domain-containing protein [Jatrophihabitans sp.]|nr:helix-turn-helix domain-containing protein [Jatrophihabitans sp.]
MGASYHQFCPVAKAMELLDERWTMLVIRELAAGSERFNELRRGLPRMSPSLLSKRLDQLVRAGVVQRTGPVSERRYTLTEAGRELRPVVEALGAWGIRWIGQLGDPDLDPKLLMWDMHRNIDHAAVPAGRTVVEFDFSDALERHWWLVITPDDADVCDADPGHPVALRVVSSLRAMVGIWLGTVSWRAALRAGTVTLDGPQQLRRGLPRWLTLSDFAAVPRPQPVAAHA